MTPRVSVLPSSDVVRRHADAINRLLKNTQRISWAQDVQTITANVDLATGYVFKIAGAQVLGPRITGWTVPTGTPQRGAFAAAAAGTASGAYVQAELQGALNRIAALEGRLVALQNDLTTQGIIGA